MAQVFTPATNTVARLSLAAAITLPIVALISVSALTRSAFATKVGMPIDQPVPFSHEHHVQELGIDCRYCHTSVDKSRFAGVPPTHTCMSCHSQVWLNSPLLAPVRESMKTGEAIEWNRVNQLPDFVYFDHSIHVARGINCNTCHGKVQQMKITEKGKAFTMAWCLQCHRNPENYVRDPADTFALYDRFRDPHGLTNEEDALRLGEDYQRTPAELQKGEALLKEMGVNKEQLTDCWICHR